MSIKDRFLEEYCNTEYNRQVNGTTFNVSKINKYIKMEVKKSTVKSVQSGGKPYETKFGMLYPHDITMTNGDAGTYSSKSEHQDKFKQGMVVDYEFIDGQYPKIKPHFAQSYNQKFGSGGRSANPQTGTVTNGRTGEVKSTDTQWQIIRQSSVRTAAEFCKGNCTIEDLLRDADVIAKYCYFGNLPSSVENEKPF
jgi:hypothetical protein